MKICEIEECVPRSRTFELNPGARYLVVLEHTSVDHAIEIQNWLQAQKINAVVLPVGCKLFEIEP
jgi:hypothetical protein